VSSKHEPFAIQAGLYEEIEQRLTLELVRASIDQWLTHGPWTGEPFFFTQNVLSFEKAGAWLGSV
jgi:hypothetical protein